MTASETPVRTRYRGADYSEMSHRVAGNSSRSCVICRETLRAGTMYLYTLVRVSKAVSHNHICRACALKTPGSELHTAWNLLLTQGDS